MHKTMRSLFILFLAACSTLIVGCGSSVPVIKPFKMDIQQGNVVTSKMLLQLRPGMTKSQVKFIMGTPLVVDSFHTNRWDYFYQLRQAGKVVEQRRVILDFEKDLLARVRGDVVPQGTAGADTGAVALAKEPIVVPPRPAQKEGVFENLQFWKSNQAVETQPKPAEIKATEKGLLDRLKFWGKEDKAIEVAKPAATKESVSPIEPAAVIAAPVIALPDASPSAVETPSMLAVPIEIAPESNAPAAIDVVKESPAIKSPTIEAPVAVLPVIDSPAVEPMPVQAKAALPADPPVMPSKQDERFIFRFDRNLNTKNLEAAPTPQEALKPVAKTNKPEEKLLPIEAEPGYFERMLEKIGF